MARDRKQQEIKIVYEQANLSTEEIQRRLSRAYRVIFDTAWEIYKSEKSL